MHGFLGLRPAGGTLHLNPGLPAAWEEVAVRLRFHGCRVRVRASHNRPPGTRVVRVEQLEPPHLLVLHSTTHVPATWQARLGASIDWAWIFALDDSGDGTTRLLVRTRVRTKAWWLPGVYRATLIPADCVMATGMLPSF
jgi:hypothetical protein